ncbi:hypothetical protein TI05_02830 [Achromatium sp. WMS3]|nr:hypothetical protein TI05_02830 [Achromatium sp. WMS3]
MFTSDQGRFFLGLATKVAITGLRSVPIAGAFVEIGQECYRSFQEEQEKVALSERLARIEQASQIEPQEARAIAAEVIAAAKQAGDDISPEKSEAIQDIIAFTPANIKSHTQHLLNQARDQGTAPETALPITEYHSTRDQQVFYQSLLPAHRSQFQPGAAIPGGHPEWRLHSLLGVGGFGEVWEARNEDLRFAVKFCLNEISAKTLTREATTLAALRKRFHNHPHPNIVRLADLNLKTEPYWLAFDFISGQTLEQHLRTHSLNWQESLRLFYPIVAAMAEVHQIPVIHRDLKPANIIITPDGIPKITDFGIGKVIVDQHANNKADPATQFTTLGFGSTGYCSQEQRSGMKPHPADDTYALGIILWQMLTHTLKVPDLNWASQLYQQQIPQPLKDLVSACFQSREQRPQDASAVLTYLAPVMSQEQIPQAIHHTPSTSSSTVPTQPSIPKFTSQPQTQQQQNPKPVSTASISNSTEWFSIHKIGQIWVGLGLALGGFLSLVFLANAFTPDTNLFIVSFIIIGFMGISMVIPWTIWLTVMRRFHLLENYGVLPNKLHNMLVPKAGTNLWQTIFITLPSIILLLGFTATLFLPVALWWTNLISPTFGELQDDQGYLYKGELAFWETAFDTYDFWVFVILVFVFILVPTLKWFDASNKESEQQKKAM